MYAMNASGGDHRRQHEAAGVALPKVVSRLSVMAAVVCLLLSGCADDKPSSDHGARWAARVCAKAASSNGAEVMDAEPISAEKARRLGGADLPSLKSSADLALCKLRPEQMQKFAGLPSGERRKVRMLADLQGNSTWVQIAN